MSVFIATPTFIQPTTAYTFSLANTVAELVKANINFQLGIPDDVKNVDDGRNLLVKHAREGNCTHILFVDSDQFWSSRDILRLLERASDGHEIVAGIYPFKSPAEGYPAGRILAAYEDGLLSVSFAPTGFMLIDLSVFDRLDALIADGSLDIPKTAGNPHYFMRTFNENTYDGGDVTFCRRAIKAGYKVLIDPDINVGHVGFHRFKGNFAEFLAASDENLDLHLDKSKDRNRTVASAAPEAGAPDFDDREALISLLKSPMVYEVGDWIEDVLAAYGNRPWASTSNLLKTLAEWFGGPIAVEAGCGATTLIMAAIGIKVIAYEEHAEWAKAVYQIAEEAGIEDNIEIFVAPIDPKTKWYTSPVIDEHLRKADMLLIDGPKRRDEVDRSYPIRRCKQLRLSPRFIYDDIDSLTGVTTCHVSPADGAQHPFCYGVV